MRIEEVGAVTIVEGDALESLAAFPDQSVNCCVTSPPYWGLRDYGVAGQLGLESTPQEYVEKLVAVFREVRRVLRDDGTLWLNLGDSYSRDPGKGEKFRGKSKEYLSHNHDGLTGPAIPRGLKPKDLVGVPWRVAFALQADGWYLRQDIIWAKPNPMPESVRDRCTKSHEYIFLLAKSEKYYCNMDAIKEPTTTGYRSTEFKPTSAKDKAVTSATSATSASMNGRTDELVTTRNKRDVWIVSTNPYKEAHFATFPPDLIEPCILAGCPEGGVILDPFGGSGTTGVVAQQHGRRAILLELNPTYVDLAVKRITGSMMKAAV